MTGESRGHICTHACSQRQRHTLTHSHKHKHITERISPEQMFTPSAHASTPAYPSAHSACAATQLTTRPHPVRHLTLLATLPNRPHPTRHPSPPPNPTLPLSLTASPTHCHLARPRPEKSACPRSSGLELRVGSWLAGRRCAVAAGTFESLFPSLPLFPLHPTFLFLHCPSSFSTPSSSFLYSVAM